MTLVSIVTPSFNQAAFLEQTLRSVLEQDHPRIEYLVIDGGSSDGSPEILARYAERLAFWTSEPDSGQAEAVNKGMARAQGEIVAWLNSDDYYLPGAVTAAVRAFERCPDAVMVHADMLAVDAVGETINRLEYDPVDLEALLCFRIIGQPAVFMRRAAFERAGGLDPGYHFLLDHHLWIRLALQGPAYHVDETWAAARYHAAAKNRARAAGFGREAFRILEWAAREPSLAPALQRLGRRARAAAERVDARYLLDGGQPGAALGAWTRALLVHPPTALQRMNLFVSAALNLIGLEGVRQAYLRRRQRSLARRGPGL